MLQTQRNYSLGPRPIRHNKKNRADRSGTEDNVIISALNANIQLSYLNTVSGRQLLQFM